MYFKEDFVMCDECKFRFQFHFFMSALSIIFDDLLFGQGGWEDIKRSKALISLTGDLFLFGSGGGGKSCDNLRPDLILISCSPLGKNELRILFFWSD